MVPNGWKYYNLSEVTEVKIGGTPSRNIETFWHNALDEMDAFPWVCIRDLNQEPVVTTKETITKKGIASSNVKLITAGTVMMSFKLTIGRVARAGCDLYTNEAIAAFVPKNDKVISEYLYYVLPEAANSDDIDQAVKGKTLNKEKILNLTFLLPSLQEQKRIAEILSGVDAAIEATQAVIEQTKKVKQGLLQTLLTRGIGHTKFKPSPLGEIPEGWSISALGEVSFDEKGLQTGPFGSQLHAADYSEHGTPVIMPKDISNGVVVVGDIARVPPNIRDGLKKHAVEEGDILFGRRGDIGRCCLITRNEVGFLCGTGCLRARINRSLIDPSYLIVYLQTDAAQEWLNENAVGQTMLNLNTAILAKLPLVLPELHEQHKIAGAFLNIDNQLMSENKKLASLQQLKKGLMDDLLTGKVRVANAPRLQLVHSSQETASVHKVQPAFKRAVLAAEITYQLYQNPKFGSVKQEKIIDLCERHLDLDADLDRTAYRHAAGPYDNKAKRSIEANFKRQKWFDVQRVAGQGVKYRPLVKCGDHKSYFNRYFGHVSSDIQTIISLLTAMDTEQCEIVATLYAAWNDFLLKGHTPDDETIVNDVLNNWHDSKRKIEKDRWLSALGWMRQKHLVPHGGGRLTKATRTD